MVNGLSILGHLEAVEANIDGAIVHYEAALEIAEAVEIAILLPEPLVQV